jgi:DNA (cytosine-5)-methyltransferase 1
VAKAANQKPTVAELFAGVGGFRLGLEKAGFETIFSNQWEPSTKTQHASDVYVARFGTDGHSNEDIATVKQIPKVDLLVGGFPCQDYSVAKSLNASKGLQGKKGVLWWEILRLVQQAKPPFIFLENVDRLLKSPSSQRGRDFAMMLRTLGDEGYFIEWRVASAADYGFPQRRIRVFIIARQLKTLPKGFKLNPAEAIYSDGILARALPINNDNSPVSEIEIPEDVLALSKSFGTGSSKSPFQNSGVYYKGIAYTVKTQANSKRRAKVLGDVLVEESKVPDEYWIDAKRIKDWQYLKGAKSIERIHKDSGTSYQYAEGSMAFPDLLTNPSRTILTGEGGSTPSRFKHIIKIGRRYRRLTPIELERLNGFPDNWTKTGTDGRDLNDARRAFFMGNALVIGMVELVGKVIAKELESFRSQRL